MPIIPRHRESARTNGEAAGFKMKTFFAAILISLLSTAAGAADAIIEPEWAYPPRGDGVKGFGDIKDVPTSVPGSLRRLKPSQTSPLFGDLDFGGMEDWFPERHALMPDIVISGRRPDAIACASCHLTSGQGQATTGMLAGLNPEYFLQQIKDFAEGRRASVSPQRTETMVAIAKALTDAEIRDAAKYFATQTPAKWVDVIEADTVPITEIVRRRTRVVTQGGGREPLGERIIEVPAEPARWALFDPYSGYVAYVPVGSVAQGKALVTTGAGKTLACGVCHGPDLKGLGTVPAIAGRLPTYLARQLLDIKQGSRNGAGAALMMPVVQDLTEKDVINIVAYIATLPPA
jgi:cytochrome c553